MIESVGLVAWDWFVLVLSTWRSVIVNKQNLRAIPLVILKSVSQLVFQEFGREVQAAESRLTMKETEYVLQNVVGKRIGKIGFCGQSVAGMLRLTSAIAGFNVGTQRIPGPRLAAVRELSFEEGCFETPHLITDPSTSQKQLEKFFTVRLVSMTPNLVSVTGCPLFAWLEGLKRLRCLKVILGHDLGAGFGSSARSIYPNLVHLAVLVKYTSRSVEQDFHGLVIWMHRMLQSGQLRALELQGMDFVFFGHLVDTLGNNSFPKIEKLMMSIDGWTEGQPNPPQILGTFPRTTTLVSELVPLSTQISLTVPALRNLKTLVLSKFFDDRFPVGEAGFQSFVSRILQAHIERVFFQKDERDEFLVVSKGRVEVQGGLGLKFSFVKATVICPHLRDYDSVRVVLWSDGKGDEVRTDLVGHLRHVLACQFPYRSVMQLYSNVLFVSNDLGDRTAGEVSFAWANPLMMTDWFRL